MEPGSRQEKRLSWRQRGAKQSTRTPPQGRNVFPSTVRPGLTRSCPRCLLAPLLPRELGPPGHGYGRGFAHAWAGAPGCASAARVKSRTAMRRCHACGDAGDGRSQDRGQVEGEVTPVLGRILHLLHPPSSLPTSASFTSSHSAPWK